MTKVLKFLGLVIGMSLAAQYVPFGCLISTAIIFYALWKLV